MFLRFVSAFAVICLLAMSFRAEARDPETMGILKERAENFVECMLKGSVNSIAGEMHPSLRQTYTNEVVRNIFGDLHQRGGRFEEMGEASLSIGRNTSVIALVPLHYANNKVTARLVFERAGRHSRITEFAILPYTEPDADTAWRDPNAAPPAPKPLPSPPYANSLVFSTEAVELAREGREPLTSTLYMPTIATEASPVPAVVLVADANTTGELPMVGTSNPLRDIAEGLATRGVAVVLVVPMMDEVGIATGNVEAESELNVAPEIIIVAEEEAQAELAAEAPPADAEAPADAEELATEAAPQTLAESIGRVIASRPQIDNGRVFEMYNSQPLLQAGATMLNSADASGLSLKTFAIEQAMGMYSQENMPSRSELSAEFLSVEDEEANAGMVPDDPFPAKRAYPNTGPYLIEEVTDGDTTTYGHVSRAFIEDAANFIRSGRFG